MGQAISANFKPVKKRIHKFKRFAFTIDRQKILGKT
jgi:hypothetical protein